MFVWLESEHLSDFDEDVLDFLFLGFGADDRTGNRSGFVGGDDVKGGFIDLIYTD